MENDTISRRKILSEEKFLVLIFSSGQEKGETCLMLKILSFL